MTKPDRDKAETVRCDGCGRPTPIDFIFDMLSVDDKVVQRLCDGCVMMRANPVQK